MIGLYRKARAIPGVKKVLIASGLRYDLAVETPEYVEKVVNYTQIHENPVVFEEFSGFNVKVDTANITE